MIQQHVTISAPSARANSGLSRISNNDNQVVYLDNGTETRLIIGLCDVQKASTREVKKALAYFSASDWFQKNLIPSIRRYVLEDGQSILHVTYEGHPELSILVQESHEDYRNENWREPFSPYWGEFLKGESS